MASKINVQVIHKETIKPSSPTPHHLRNLRLSVLDQFQPDIYVAIILVYQSSEEIKSDHHSLVAEKSKLLKTSLSKALSKFYPFAGEMEYNVSISCNDSGAAFLEAQVNCPISKILENSDCALLQQLIPIPPISKQAEAGHLLLVQANVFECGGLAIGVCCSHKVSDASTLSTFIQSWAEIACRSAITTDLAEFGVASTLFPPHDYFNSQQSTWSGSKAKCVRKVLVFAASKIVALKAKAASDTVPNPTRVEAVSALIWKCIMEASRLNLGYARLSSWRQAVNMRKIVVEPLAKKLLGNFVWYSTAKIQEVSEAGNFQILVAKLRKSVEEIKVNHSNGITGEDIIQFFKEYDKFSEKDDMDNYYSTSWCAFPFHSTNFGWGTPSCIRLPGNLHVKNLILLKDVNDGIGIEAHVTLKEEEMAMFETNQELLAYASLTSSSSVNV